jgi:hypothetical protein
MEKRLRCRGVAFKTTNRGADFNPVCVPPASREINNQPTLVAARTSGPQS